LLVKVSFVKMSSQGTYTIVFDFSIVLSFVLLISITKRSYDCKFVEM